MDYNKARGGKWANTDDLRDGMTASIVDECKKEESRFKDKDGNPKVENIAKVQFEGMPEAVNTRINWTTINGLIDAYGKRSEDWIHKTLTVKLVDAMVGDTMRTIMYLVPEGFQLAKTPDRKLVIRTTGVGTTIGGPAAPIEYPKDDINPDDIPF